MHRSEEFLLRQAAGLTVIVPVGPAAVRFPGMISVNATGEFLWNALAAEQTLDSLVDALTAGKTNYCAVRWEGEKAKLFVWRVE